MTTTQQATGAARRLARLAAISNAGILACPYPPDATGLASAARHAWLEEYRLRRPAPVDLGDRITTLADGPDAPDTGTMPTRPQPDLFAGPAQ